jgi:hypothetical protein
MRRFNLFTSALLGVGLTALVLSHPGWLWAKKNTHPAGRHTAVRAGNRVDDWLASDMGRRWKNCEPAHWRGYVLQH